MSATTGDNEGAMSMVRGMATVYHVLGCSNCQLSKGPSPLSPIVRLCPEGERLQADAPADDRRAGGDR